MPFERFPPIPQLFGLEPSHTNDSLGRRRTLKQQPPLSERSRFLLADMQQQTQTPQPSYSFSPFFSSPFLFPFGKDESLVECSWREVADGLCRTVGVWRQDQPREDEGDARKDPDYHQKMCTCYFPSSSLFGSSLLEYATRMPYPTRITHRQRRWKAAMIDP